MVRRVTIRDRSPWWAWPGRLSLDAPLAAAAWLFILAKSWGVAYHETHNYVIVALVVWISFIAVRMLDLLIYGPEAVNGEAAAFLNRRRGVFALALAIAVPVAAALILHYTPVALAGYLVGQGLLAGGYFVMALFAAPEPGQISHARNVLGGGALAFGTAMTAHVYNYGQGAAEMIRTEEFAVYAVLCILTISAVDLWRHAAASGDEDVRLQDELALSLPLGLLAVAAFVFARRAVNPDTAAFFNAVLTSTALLFLLNRARAAFSLERLRFLVAAAMLAALPVFLLIR